MQPLSPSQDTHQSDFQQHSHPGGSEEEGLSTKPGETSLQEQHHPATELTAPAYARHERLRFDGSSDDALLRGHKTSMQRLL